MGTLLSMAALGRKSFANASGLRETYCLWNRSKTLSAGTHTHTTHAEREQRSTMNTIANKTIPLHISSYTCCVMMHEAFARKWRHKQGKGKQGKTGEHTASKAKGCMYSAQ